MRLIPEFETRHGPQSHSAHLPGGATIVVARPTEIDLVRELNKMGVDLAMYDFESTGDENRLLTIWRLNRRARVADHLRVVEQIPWEDAWSLAGEIMTIMGVEDE